MFKMSTWLPVVMDIVIMLEKAPCQWLLPLELRFLQRLEMACRRNYVKCYDTFSGLDVAQYESSDILIFLRTNHTYYLSNGCFWD